MTGIAEMFDELSWRRDDYERALEEWGTWRAVQDVTPERKQYLHEYSKKRKRWLEPAHRERQRIYMRERRAAGKGDTSRERHSKRYRDDEAYRERKKLASREYQRRRRAAMRAA